MTNSLSTEKTVTTKELAETLGVSNMAIKRVLDATNNLNGTVKVENGKQTYFTEKQATLIKQEIQKHHNLQSRQIDNVSTDYEMEMMTQKVLAYHIQKANEYKQRAEIAEGTLNRLTDARGLFSMGTAAKALKLPYGSHKLFEQLRNFGILSADNSPKQDQVNAGHFKVVIKPINETVGNKAVTLVTSKGLVYLSKKLNTEIDTSVLPDCA